VTRNEYEACLDALAAQANRQISESQAMLDEIDALRKRAPSDDAPPRAQRAIDERDGVALPSSRRSGARAILAGMDRGAA
jgi:hypothetical protein